MSNKHIDPALLRGLTHARYARRQVLRLAGLGAAAAGLAACGVKGSAAPKPTLSGSASASAVESAVQKFWAGKTDTGHVNWANWPVYIDPKHESIKEFTAATGTSVTYSEVINDDPSFFLKIQPELEAGQYTGYDLIVITDGVEFTELLASNYIAPLDHSQLPNFTANAGAQYRKEFFDPDNVYSVPWQSGFTGIGYNEKYVKTPPTSLQDLLDPRYKGKIGMMSDTQELGNFAMLAVGVKPETSTPADWTKAASWLQQQKDAGVVRSYYDQGYLQALADGDVWLSMAWSGDIAATNVTQPADEQLGFVIPKEGGSIWTDNLMIPITATNPAGAIKLIDWYYQPKMAALVDEGAKYASPVPAAQAIMASDAASATGSDKKVLETLSTSPFMWPDEQFLANLHYYRSFASSTEQDAYDAVFAPITSS